MMTNPVHSLPGSDDIHRELLSNGIVVLSRANFNSPSVVVSGYLQAGALFDPAFDLIRAPGAFVFHE